MARQLNKKAEPNIMSLSFIALFENNPEIYFKGCVFSKGTFLMLMISNY